MTATRTRAASSSSLRKLAEAMGIVPKYLDQTGTEWRETTDDARRALLAAMGIDASTSDAAAAALRALRDEARRELVAPVRVVERADETASRHIPVQLAVPPGKGARWEVELTTEDGATAREEGAWPGGLRREIPVPWPGADPPLGYHRVAVRMTIHGKPRDGEQTLIVVPSHAVTPDEILGAGRRAFGFVANLYTVRTEHDWGVGDVAALRALVEWAGECGAAFVGLNPLHALLNRGKDISPYSPVSRLFRNPLYLDVEAVPELRHAPRVAKRLEHPELQEELARLREAPDVNYERVMELKMPVLEELHAVFLEHELARGTERARAYEAFVREHDPELTKYSEWMAGGVSGVEGNGLPTPHTPHPTPGLHCWIQFELDRQLGEVAALARRAGLPIGLYQDLAIGTSPTGADVSGNPGLFLEGVSVGAPPDPYSAEGQNWGLPPIDPRALRRDRYRYFVRLVRAGFRHAGALRIDHAMGLFRLFWIPDGRSGKDGAYVTYPHADLLGILALESVRHGALVVGEDLGTVPPEVPPALEKWKILSSKVLYFEREEGGFAPAARYAPLALATANTHDMATLSGFRAGRDIAVRAEVGLIPDADALAAARAERERDRVALGARLVEEGIVSSARALEKDAAFRGAVHEFLCRTPAALVGIALDDLAGELDAVNVPGVGPDRHPSWTRRMSMTVEEMRASDDVKRAMGCDERAHGR